MKLYPCVLGESKYRKLTPLLTVSIKRLSDYMSQSSATSKRPMKLQLHS